MKKSIKNPEYEIKVIQNVDQPSTVMMCKMPTPGINNKPRGISVDVVIKELDDGLHIKGNVQELKKTK